MNDDTPNAVTVDLLMLSARLADDLGEDWTLDDAEIDAGLPETAGEMWLLLGEVERIKRAITTVGKALTQEFGRLLPEGQATRFGGEVYKVAEKMRELVVDADDKTKGERAE